jgi:L-alanine-DL-glutamate epimerase-like enolase superfamily enzyme
VGLAADLHLASAVRYTDLVEYLTGSPFVDDLVEKKWKLDDSGMLQVPNGPGLGISLNPDAVEKHTGQRLTPE